MRVFLIPEDFRKDQYILKPIISALFRSLNRPNAQVRVCQDPLLGGVTEALNWSRIEEIIDRYQGMVDIFILCVDRDGVPGRRQALDRIERRSRTHLGRNILFLGENAWQELEVWALAGIDLPTEWSWRDIRSEVHSKEVYFEPMADKLGVADGPGAGRKAMSQMAARRFHRILSLCPEDIGNIHNRISQWLANP